MDKKEQDRRAAWVPGAVIVGAGPSGLAAAACLAAHGVPANVLEMSDSLASTWRHRTYDRLTLHLPKRFCELPLLPFPEGYPAYPSKDQFVAYMESYAAAAGVAPRFGARVEEAAFDSAAGVWVVRLAGGGQLLLARWLVVATGENAEPRVPDFPGMRQFAGLVMHTCEYKSGEAFAGKKVLVVGCGNSGMEVSLDLCRHGAKPSLVVRNTVHVLPREMFGLSTFGIAMALLKCFRVQVVDRILLAAAHLMLGDTGQLGLRRPKTGPIELKSLTGRTPVLDVGTLDHIKTGKIKVSVVGAVKEVTRRGVRFADGKEEQFDAIILATGYRSNVPSWLKDGGDLFTREGTPKIPFPNGWKGNNGLYTVGFSQRGLLGASSDALNVARDINCKWKDTTGPTNNVLESNNSCLTLV
ncbi:indole-3-pyruvate monooxygenase YUCCA1-like isoform X1 [Phragmites australis]|uniref:indole-3-pyruvate monooxygenase YUCCA1-like isoform X1 n=1 Tax=Phragmites australis TaxID=29695 RepID=UPI002D7707E3|nr:indole-3-pyruvate monooxygenase YUCCA1-like isoform X1 [Phragmites australis]